MFTFAILPVISPVQGVFGSDSQTALQQILALSPSLLIWPANGAGWQGTSGGTLAASGQPLGLGVDLSQLQGRTLSEWLAAPTTSATLLTGYTLTNQGGTGTITESPSGTVNMTGGSLSVLADRSFTTVAGRAYQLIVTSTGTTCSVRVGTTVAGSDLLGVTVPPAGTTIFYIDARTTTTHVQLGNVLATPGSMTFTFRELPGNHLRAGTWAAPADSSRALLTAGGALNFDGVNDYYSLLQAIPITQNMTFVRAFKRLSAETISAGTGLDSTAQPHDFLWFNTNIQVQRLSDTGGSLNAGTSTSTGVFVSTGRRGATAEIIRLNGTELASRTSITAGGTVSVLGRRHTNYNAGEISFLAVFPTELTGADLALVEQIAAATNGAVLA